MTRVIPGMERLRRGRPPQKGVLGDHDQTYVLWEGAHQAVVSIALSPVSLHRRPCSTRGFPGHSSNCEPGAHFPRHQPSR